MVKILIIGSEGFIGKWVSAYYTAKAEVVTCDIVPSPTSPLHHLLSAEKSVGDILSTDTFDWCINCAGAASVGASLMTPRKDFELNTSLIADLLDGIRAHNPQCRFLNISSAAIYGNPTTLPINEKASCAPISPYGYHKYMAELLSQEYHQLFGLQTCSVRIFSAYGPGLSKQLLWDTFRKMQQNPDHITLYGTGEETRDYIYISDIVQQMDLILRNADFAGESINVANGRQISIKTVAHQIKECIAYPGAIGFNGQNRPGDPLFWEADISKVRELGYQQQVSFEEGVAQFTDWAKKYKA